MVKANCYRCLKEVLAPVPIWNDKHSLWNLYHKKCVHGRWEAQQRIEEYGLINLLELFGKPQGAPLNEKTIEITFEPEDKYAKFDGKTKKWDLPDDQGRKYDYGRAIIQ